MSFMHEETAPTLVNQGVWSATIASNAVDFLDPVDVIIPGIDGTTRWEDCPWQTRDNLDLPQRGDDCVVVFDDQTKVSVIAWWPSRRSPTVSSSPIANGPPVNPVHGDMWIAFGPVTGYVWQFVYDANWTTDAYNWKFTGGSEAYAQIGTQENKTAGGALADLATVGPSFTFQRPGVFHVRWGSLINTQNSQSGGYAGSVVCAAPGNARLSQYEADASATSGGWLSAMTEEQIEINLTPAGLAYAPQQVKLMYFANTNQTVIFGNRWLSIMPLRIK